MNLFEIAGEKGIITPEEGAIMMKIKLDLSTYIDKVEKAKSSEVISLGEAMELEEFKQNIIINAALVAAKDYEINEDEKRLIKKLVEILSNKEL